ncbi:hypothetical protein CI109_100470 [Kwoniella shandongensis]|uniref:Uncharacterized protein n=1 Tax=Kwoniella shandongensis TaxID=1734106 RepID=A0A5M6C3N9_9TREE|nr:uncharacterized protein CI109_001687 [Kwoniella shandongensis]KAA5529748.1 hypothetical protein CI109_001687 [Kwoniella shandongensis]
MSPPSRDSTRSINLPSLVPHTSTYRAHKSRSRSPDTPTTPTQSSYFPSVSSSYDEPWNARVAARSPPQPPPFHRHRTASETLSSLLDEETLFNDNPAVLHNKKPNSTDMADPSSMKRKVVIMGSPSVGKTSLTQQYVSPPTYNASYYPTIEDTLHKTVTHNGIQYECEIIDSAGLEEYSLFPGKYGLGVHGYMLVYSITSRQSFEMIPIIHDKILDYAGLEKVPCVVVGQKVDLDGERAVTTAEGEALAKKLSAGFIESSAKDNKNVVRAFDALLVEMQKEYNPAPEKKKASWWSWGAK